MMEVGRFGKCVGVDIGYSYIQEGSWAGIGHSGGVVFLVMVVSPTPSVALDMAVGLSTPPPPPPWGYLSVISLVIHLGQGVGVVVY